MGERSEARAMNVCALGGQRSVCKKVLSTEDWRRVSTGLEEAGAGVSYISFSQIYLGRRWPRGGTHRHVVHHSVYHVIGNTLQGIR